MHGFGANKESFSAQISYFAQFFHVIAIDFPGFGKSSPIPYPFCVKDYANLVLDLLNALHIEKFYLLGHSFGGRVAIYIAAHTNRVTHLVLADSAGVKPRFSLRRQVKKRQFQRKKNKVGEGERAQFGSVDYRSLSPIEKHSFSLVIQEDLTPMLGNIRCPTLVIFGAKDRETPLYMARKLYKGIKCGSLVVIKNAGHFAMVQSPTAFNQAVMAFFLSKKGE
ncbi:MAG: alpha/beta hydrolase [Clostridia bacterium]|nr:alpha/beta hydrolase [Clostridia bacterium]